MVSFIFTKANIFDHTILLRNYPAKIKLILFCLLFIFLFQQIIFSDNLQINNFEEKKKPLESIYTSHFDSLLQYSLSNLPELPDIEFSSDEDTQQYEFAAYLRWLEQNHDSNSPEIVSVLIKSVITAPTHEQALELLSSYLNKIKLNTEFMKLTEAELYIYTILLLQGSLEELTGKLSNALQTYSKATVIQPPECYLAQLKSVELLLYLGDIQQAQIQAQSILSTATDFYIRVQALFLLSLAYSVTDHSSGAFALLKPAKENIEWLSPYMYVMLESTARAAGFFDEAEKYKQKLLDRFPNSPEAKLITQEINRLPHLFHSLGMMEAGFHISKSDNKLLQETENEITSIDNKDNKLLYIQTGSFRDHENARYSVKDLIQAEFAAEILGVEVGENFYFRVVIPVTEESLDDMLMKLREQGFQGYPLY